LFFLFFAIYFIFADMSIGPNLQIIDELQRQAQHGLKPYESANDERVRKAGEQHSKLYERAQEASRNELRAAENIEKSFRSSGHKWDAEKINQALDRMSAHMHTASKIQQAAFNLRGKIFLMFNNEQRLDRFNPQRFFKLVKLDGMKWLDYKMFDAQTKLFLPETWRISSYGSISKPKTEIRGIHATESFVRTAYSDLYGKGQKLNTSEIKVEAIRAKLSGIMSNTARGPSLKAPGGWMKPDNPITIGQ
jgi:hypothetical protein